MKFKQLAHLIPDIVKASASSGLQLIITIMATPIMTRLYAPEAYGEFGMINSFAVLLVGVGQLSLPAAYAQEWSEIWRLKLMRSMLLLGCLLTALSAVMSMGLMGYQSANQHQYLSWAAALLLPLLVLSYAVWQPILMLAVSRKAFDATAIARLVNAITARGLTLACGAVFAGHSAFIVLATLFGNGISSAYLLRKSLITLPEKKANYRRIFNAVSPTKAKLYACLSRYRDFAIFYTLSSQSPVLLTFMLQLIIASTISKEMTGHYVLATSILSLPVTLVAMASASIIFMHLREIAKMQPDALWRHTLGLLIAFCCMGAIIMLPLVFFGAPLFRIAFGANWEQAGHIAGALAPAYIGSFAVVALQSIFRVCDRLKLGLLIEIVFLPPLLTLSFWFFNRYPFEMALNATCAMLAIYYGCILAMSIFISARYRSAEPVQHNERTV